MIPFIYNSKKTQNYQKADQWLPGVKKMGSGGRGITKRNEKTFGGDAYIYNLDCDRVSRYIRMSNCTLYAHFIMSGSPQ